LHATYAPFSKSTPMISINQYLRPSPSKYRART
jgi:hypothetical protein